jgi:hypothetical protein
VNQRRARRATVRAVKDRPAPFFLVCNGCGGDGDFSVALIPQHGLHVFCDACQQVCECVTPERLTELLANPKCAGCGATDGNGDGGTDGSA